MRVVIHTGTVCKKFKPMNLNVVVNIRQKVSFGCRTMITFIDDSTFKITSQINWTWLYLPVSAHIGSITDRLQSWDWHLWSALKLHCLLIYLVICSLPLRSQQWRSSTPWLTTLKPLLVWPTANRGAQNHLSSLGSGQLGVWCLRAFCPQSSPQLDRKSQKCSQVFSVTAWETARLCVTCRHYKREQLFFQSYVIIGSFLKIMFKGVTVCFRADSEVRNLLKGGRQAMLPVTKWSQFIYLRQRKMFLTRSSTVSRDHRCRHKVNWCNAFYLLAYNFYSEHFGTK